MLLSYQNLRYSPAMIIFPPDDILALIKNPPPEMRVQFDGDSRYWFALTLFSLLNPSVGGMELGKAVVEALEGSRDYPSLRDIRP